MTSRLQPAVDKITTHPWVLRYVPRLADPDLWHLNRRSAARAVAVGLFCGLIPGPLQVFGSILLCLAWRANFPVAVVTTFYTNPFTIVPLYVVAYEYGSLVVRDAAPLQTLALPPSMEFMTSFSALFDWMVQLGKPLAVGLLVAGGHARHARLHRGARRLALPCGVGLAAARAPARRGVAPA